TKFPGSPSRPRTAAGTPPAWTSAAAPPRSPGAPPSRGGSRSRGRRGSAPPGPRARPDRPASRGGSCRAGACGTGSARFRTATSRTSTASRTARCPGTPPPPPPGRYPRRRGPPSSRRTAPARRGEARPALRTRRPSFVPLQQVVERGPVAQLAQLVVLAQPLRRHAQLERLVEMPERLVLARAVEPREPQMVPAQELLPLLLGELLAVDLLR